MKRLFASAHTPMVAFAVVLAVLPLTLPNAFYYDVAIRMALNAAAVIGLNLLVGYTGQISLGHAGFFGIGAYASAILCSRYGWSAPTALLVGLAANGLIALAIARPILRLRGHYLAMATVGFGIIVNIILITETAWTSGPDGMSVPGLSLGKLQISGDRLWYTVAALVLLLVTAGARNLVRSPAGRALQAIHGSETAARTSGVDVTKFKVRVFVASAMVTGAVGSLNAHYVGFVTPGVASVFHSIEFITMVVVGGMASIWGSIAGAVLLTLLPQALSTFEGWETVVFGAILMVFMIALPSGIVPSLQARLRRTTT